jgi:predicted RecB family nuclease
MQRRNGQLTYSPSDLNRYCTSVYASWMTRFALEHPQSKPLQDDADQELELYAELGLKHELAFLAELKTQRQVVEISQNQRREDSLAQTIAAMQSGAEVIFQAYLTNGALGGYADFLFRRDDGASSFGNYYYEAWDTKLAKTPKPYFVIQLCAYSELLEHIQGTRPTDMVVVLGNNERARYGISDYFWVYQHVKHAFLSQMQGHFDHIGQAPFPDPSENHFPYQTLADETLTQADHLSAVATITKKQIRTLNEAGIATTSDLATSTPTWLPGVDQYRFARLKKQAALQRDSQGLAVPKFEVITPQPRRGLGYLPTKTAHDLYYDIEGYPLVDGGLEYLHGVTYVDDHGKQDVIAFWAHDAAEEKRAFQDLVDFFMARYRANPHMHIYHYAPYEISALRRLSTRYATREDEVDTLLQNEVLVDLYTVVKHGLLIGAKSYSIKTVEKIYWADQVLAEGTVRSGEVETGGASVVEYYKWTESGQSKDPKQSPILAELEAYNKLDCDSTLALYDWLWSLKATHCVVSDLTEPNDESQAELSEPPVNELNEFVLLKQRLEQRLIERAELLKDDPRAQGDQLLAHLMNFYRRELKPSWWAFFDRLTQTELELFDDSECLVDLTLIEQADIGRGSKAFTYTYDPTQETKLSTTNRVAMLHNSDVHGEVQSIDRDSGRIKIKVTKKSLAKVEDDTSLQHIGVQPRVRNIYDDLDKALLALVEHYLEHNALPSALEQFLLRAEPPLKGNGSVCRLNGESASDAALRIAPLLNGATLCIQGPPGTGKTFTGVRMIKALLEQGYKVGVTSNSHKAIENVLNRLAPELRTKPFKSATSTVKRARADDPLLTFIESKEIIDIMDTRPLCVGGTAWAFVRQELAGCFDYLFVDEASQVSLANLVAMSASTTNIILMGDQQQLGQPLQGSHPGEAGHSALSYLLGDHTIIPDALGLFLDTSYRMRPSVCSFISSAYYNGQLLSAPQTESRLIRHTNDVNGSLANEGVHLIEVPHQGNSASSPEEVSAICAKLELLLKSEFSDDGGQTWRPITSQDIVVVAPYNVQVNRLKAELPEGVAVGTVDKFQGQEAPIVLVSMTTSDAEDSPRGADFVLNANRLNVAISRAQVLALVFASPTLLEPRLGKLEHLKQVNHLLRLQRKD